APGPRWTAAVRSTSLRVSEPARQPAAAIPERRTSPRLSEIAWTRTTASSRLTVGSGTGRMTSRPGASGSTTTARLVAMGCLLRAARIPPATRRFLTLVQGVSFDSGMTERKPAGKSWESWREELIRLAREEGAFENLPGAGKPLADLGESYDPDWWVKKLVQREKVSMLAPSLELLRKVEAEIERIWTLSDEAAVRERIRALNA